MFEEVPREPRGLSGLSARRFVLGPFIIGGGVVLTTLGGSAALAATVITASAIGFNDLPPHGGHPAAISTTSASQAGRPAAAPSSKPAAVSSVSKTRVNAEAAKPLPSAPPMLTAVATPTRSTSSTPAGTSAGTSAATGTGSGSAAASKPTGNAIVYLSSYDRETKRLRYSYAARQRTPGTDGHDVYVVNDPAQFSAGLAAAIEITSGGGICGPAGSTCTADQLIAAAGAGLFAEVAIDADGNLKVVIEKAPPSKLADAQVPPSSSPVVAAPRTPSASPSGSG